MASPKISIQLPPGVEVDVSVGGAAVKTAEPTTSPSALPASEDVRDFVADCDNLQPSEVESWNSGGTAGILPMERAKASFEIEKMTNFIDGGKKETARRRWIVSATDGERMREYDDERNGENGAVAKNFLHFMDVHKEHLDKMYVPKGNEMLYMEMGKTMGGYPGFGLFLLTVIGQASEEQLGWFLWRTYTMQLTGAYAQTELGHGSNVRGLQTTAHYDKNTQEFVLNTPSLHSMKWWPSSMATATHAVVYAQLIIDGIEYGVHVFWLQLRDENLEPCEGIEVGDIGTKVGENEVDIGYLRLKNVRIPRKHMMEKRQHVTPDGRYIKHNAEGGNEKGAYLTMIGARVALVAGSSVALSKAATIAIRYNCVRKQGFKNTGAGVSFKSEENAIIDYKLNQFKLLKELSVAFAIRITSNWLTERMAYLQENPDAIGDDLPEIHASAAGLKGYCCNAAAIGIEELRKTCGGAGYLLASGIAQMEADYKWRATAEGDTVVMLLQTARYLMKAAADAKAGRPLAGLTSCLSVLSEIRTVQKYSAAKGMMVDSSNFDPLSYKPPSATGCEQFMDVEYLLALFQYRTVAQVGLMSESLKSRQASGETYDQAWTALTMKGVRTGQSHVLYFMLSKFVEMIKTCEDPQCKAVLTNVCVLFALSDLVLGDQWVGLLDITQMELAEEACDMVCAALRPEAVALVDSWDYPDRTLNSTIGGYDGNVYEAQYLAAVKSPLNKRKVPTFFKAIKEYLDLDFLAQRNSVDPSWNPEDDEEVYPEGVDATKASSKL